MEDFLSKKILPEAGQRLSKLYKCENLPVWAKQSIEELVNKDLVDEINNRFFRMLKFGTGGMRSRTIGNIITEAERGTSTTRKPDFASIGTAYLNDFNIIGATIALFSYCKKFLQRNRRGYEMLSVVIAYDVRHFSKHFAELSASTWKKLGGYPMLYPSQRSTPQLSFSVRELKCIAGIMITASHNPWHDNGFKSYFYDGAQMVEPHASGVIKEFANIEMEEICQFCEKNLDGIAILGEEIDERYQISLLKNTLRNDLLISNPISAVFSPLHGTGGVATIPLLHASKVKLSVVEEQNDMDPNFSTVKSPNPENQESLTLAISLAKKNSADIVLATDPDGDRLAVAAKNSFGEFEMFTGNVTGSLLADYRISQMKFLKKIPPEGSSNAAIIKTFVTTTLLDKIAKRHGIKCINTLTGFKWIGEKILHYEEKMLHKEFETNGLSLNFDKTSSDRLDTLLIQDSTLFVFGCEESYGCLASNYVRDKDANAACLMICELASYGKSVGKTLVDLRDDLFIKYGYFGESVLNINYDGSDGAQKIRNILDSYKYNPPKIVMDSSVSEIIDFNRDVIKDADEKIIPKEEFFFISLTNGIKFAVRASGTEPKIKFYLFAEAEEKIIDLKHLEVVKRATTSKLEELKKILLRDTDERSNFIT